MIRKGPDAPGIFHERKDNNVDKPKYSLHLFAGGGDRTLAGIEFVCAFENLHGKTIPNRHARSLISRLDNGRGTVADLVAVIDRWKNPPPRKKRTKFQPGQMSLGL